MCGHYFNLANVLGWKKSLRTCEKLFFKGVSWSEARHKALTKPKPQLALFANGRACPMGRMCNPPPG